MSGGPLIQNAPLTIAGAVPITPITIYPLIQTSVYVGISSLLGEIYRRFAESYNIESISITQRTVRARCKFVEPNLIDIFCNDPDILYPKLWIPFGAKQGAIIVGSYLVIGKLTDPILKKVLSRNFSPFTMRFKVLNAAICCLKNISLTYLFCSILDSTTNIKFPVLQQRNIDELFNGMTTEIARLWSKLYP